MPGCAVAIGFDCTLEWRGSAFEWQKRSLVVINGRALDRSSHVLCGFNDTKPSMLIPESFPQQHFKLFSFNFRISQPFL
jgi:hypothetical protein